MPGPTEVQKAPASFDQPQKPEKEPAEDARERLALAAWAPPEAKKDVPVPPEKNAIPKLEGVEAWEEVEKNPAKRANYLDLRYNIGLVLPYLRIENAQGKAEDDFRLGILGLFDKEKNEDVRAKLKALVESVPGSSRNDLLKELKALYKDEAKTKIVDGLTATEELRAGEREMIDRLRLGIRAADLLQALIKQDLPNGSRQQLIDELKQVFKDDPEKSKVLKDLKPGDEGKQQLAALLKTVDKENYMPTMAAYPTVARFIDVATRQTIGQFQDMKVGDTKDVRENNRFPEGAPFLRPSVDGTPMSWDLYLTKVRQGEVPCTVTSKLDGLLGDKCTIAFINAADWLHRTQGVISDMERKYNVQETWRVLQEHFGASEKWAPPQTQDARSLDSWLNSAMKVRREVTSLRDYVQAYLDLKEVTPDLRDKVINDLKKKGYEIEWDELSHKLTKFKPLVPSDLRILSPKADALVKEWQDTRKQLAEPIDKILQTYAKGDKNFLKQGTFTGPQDRGFLLMENGKIKFVVECDEVKKDEAKKRLDEAKSLLEGLEKTHGTLSADLAKQKKAFDDQFKDKKELTKLEEQEKAEAERKLRKLEGEFESSKNAVERARQKLTLCEEQKDGGKFPGRVISYIRRVDGEEEVIDRSLEGRFITKKGVDVTDEVDYKAENFKEQNRVQFDYVNYSVNTETAKDKEGKEIIGADGKPQIRIKTEREFMGDHVLNFYHKFGSSKAAVTKPEDHNSNDYMGVVSNATGKIRFLRADDIGGVFGWSSGQAWQEGLCTAANVGMDAALIYVGGSGIVSGVAKRAWGTAALGALRLGIGVTGMPFGPALRQSEWGQEALKWRHRAILFDVFVLGLGGGALNLLRGGTKAATESVSLGQKIAHYGMMSTSAVYGPEILADIYHRMELIKGKAPIQCAEAVGRDLRHRSEELDRINKPYDFKDAKIRKATEGMLDSYQSTLLTGVTDDKAKTGIESMMQTTKKLLDPQASATEKELFKRKLADAITDFDRRKKTTQAEKTAAVACLILLNTDEKGGVAEKLTRDFSYKDALKVLRKQVTERESSAEIEAVRLVAADRLANLKDPETQKPALPPRQLAAVCLQIAENTSLPEELRKRSLFDPSRPRLSFLINELEAEEADMNKPDVSAHDRQAFFGNINGFHSADIKDALIKIMSAQGDSADVRAMAAMTLHIAKQDKLEDYVRLLADYTRNIYGATDADIPNRSATKNAVAKWVVERLNKEAGASVDNPVGKSADEVRFDKLKAAGILRAFGKVDPADKEPAISADNYNAKLLECIVRTSNDGKKRELALPKDKPDLVAEVLSGLDVASLSTADRKLLLGILDMSCKSGDFKADSAAEKAKVALLSLLPQMIGGKSDSDLELRLQARQKLHANLDPQNDLAAPDRPILSMALCAAIGDVRMDDPKTVELLKGFFAQAKDGEFYEQSPLARRAALEALAVISLSDAVEISKRLKDKLETDPAVARRAAEIADLARLQNGGGKDREEVRQEIIFKLADKSKTNSEDGKNYLQNSQFKILNWNEFCDQWRKVRNDAEPGQGALLSLARGWERVSHFDYDIPQKMMDAASNAFEQVRAKMPSELVNVARDHRDSEQARKAILAMAFGLETKCESFAPANAEGEKVKRGMQCLFAKHLRDLCGKEVTYVDGGKNKTETVANKHRQLVAGVCEQFVTGAQQIDWQARYHMYEGLRTLRKDGAISSADYCEILLNAMYAPIKHQILPTNDREIGWCKAMYSEMISELCLMQPRDEKTLGLLKGLGAADGLRKHSGWESLGDSANKAYGMLTDTPMLTFRQHKDKGSVDKPEVLAEHLNKAYESYRERQLQCKTPEDFRRNRDSLVAALFKNTEGTRIAELSDPRVRVLMEMAQNSDDMAIKEAVGIAFRRANSEKDVYLYLIGGALWAEVLKKGTQYQKDEVQLQFDLMVKAYEEKAKKEGLDVAQVRKDALAQVERMKGLADSKTDGFNVVAGCYQRTVGRPTREIDPEAVDRDRVLAKKRIVEDLLAKPNLRADQFTWAMMDMMYEGAFSENDSRLGLARRIMLEGFAENVKLSTAYATLYYGYNLPVGDRELALKTVLTLKDKATNAVVKAEAGKLIAAYEKHPRMAEALKKVR